MILLYLILLGTAVLVVAHATSEPGPPILKQRREPHL